MGVDWQFTGDDRHPATGDEELLETGRPRRSRWGWRIPRWVWVAAGSAGVALAVVLATTVSPGTSRKTPAPAASSRTPAAAQTDEHRALVRQLAFYHGPLPIWIREIGAPGACPLPRRGTSPRRQISQVVLRDMPQFQVSDIGYTLDPYAAVCSLQLRARDGFGAVLVLSVTGTHRPVRLRDELDTSFVTDGLTGTAYAFLQTHDGWLVTVGVVGASNSLPSILALRHIALDHAMRW